MAAPPLKAAVPSFVTLSFFPCFLTNSKVTVPVGTPPPRATGSIAAVSSTPFSTFFRVRTACGCKTIVVVAGAIVKVVGLDWAGAKSALPGKLATTVKVPAAEGAVEPRFVPEVPEPAK